MKANELMIGDLISYDGEAMVIESLYKYNNQYRINQDQYTINFAEPIPLTSEILEKNGFETKFGYSKYNDEDDFFLVTWNSISHHLRVRTFDNDCAFDKDHIDYVHELQHALRLCGMNDLADNFKI